MVNNNSSTDRFYFIRSGLATVFLFINLFLLAGCDEESSWRNNDSSTPTELEGTWREGEEVIAMFRGSRFEIAFMEDEDENISSKAIFGFDMNITGEKQIQPNDHRVLTTILTPTTYWYGIACRSQEQVDNANTNLWCDRSDWKINTYQDITSCDGVYDFNRTMHKLIFNVENDRLRLGIADSTELIDAEGYAEVLMTGILRRMEDEKED